MSKKEEVDETEIKNHYKAIPKKFQEEERHYPNESKVKIKLPFRMCLIGASGSGKTNCLIELIEKINAFDKIIIMAKNTEEPLYATFIDSVREVEKKTGSTILTVGNLITELPELKSLNKENNTLLVVDDMINEKDKLLGRVAEYYTMGRKQYVSTVFLSQSYFKIPKIIRDNTGYFIFTKITGNRDLFMILKDFELGVTEDQLLKLYNSAATGFPNFFMIDRETNDPHLIFRKNFKGITPPSSAETKATSNIVTPSLATPKDKISKRARPAPKNTSTVPYTQYNQVAQESRPEIHTTRNKKRNDEGRLIEHVERKDMEIDPDYMDVDDVPDYMVGIEQDPDMMGDGIRKKKQRKIHKSKCSDKELRRMLRMYGFR